MNAPQAPDAMQDWINKGERMMALLEGGSLGISAAFQIGRWWAERPWGELARKRDEAMAQRDELLAALQRAERKLSAYVGVCDGDKELTGAVLPMARAAIAKVTGSA